jgi:hypothetical protein
MFGLVGLAVLEEPFEGATVMAINESVQLQSLALFQALRNVTAAVNG